MGDSPVLKQKENGNTSSTETNSKHRSLENLNMSELQSLKKDVQTRIAQNDAEFTKLDKCFENLRTCVFRMVSMIDECQMMVKSEKNERKDIQHLLRDTTCSRAYKTNVVSPMIGGIPLKKARVSLKRLGAIPRMQDNATSTSAQSHVSQASSRRDEEIIDEEMNVVPHDTVS